MPKEASYNLCLRLAFLIATVATAGSLYFSEVLKLPPCSLCWYQRIFMYPLFFIYAVDLAQGYRKAFSFTFPLVTMGFLIALYHNLLYYGVVPEDIVPCSQGISCTARLIEWFGFVSIPLLSLTAFTAQLVCCFLAMKFFKPEVQNEKQ